VTARAWWCGVLLFAAVVGTPAQPPEDPGSALEILEHRLQRNPPPMEPAPPPVGFPLYGGLSSIGGATLALIPTWSRWGPEEQPGSYFWQGIGWGSLQGLLLNGNVGLGLAWMLFPEVDMRAEYGNLLDLSQGEREQRAYRILREQAARAKQRRAAAALLTVGATALPAGAYYLGSALIGPNPTVKDFGVGYVAGIGLGSLTYAVFLLAVKSDEERTFDQLDARRLTGSEP
jgi:hypothetical protein